MHPWQLILHSIAPPQTKSNHTRAKHPKGQDCNVTHNAASMHPWQQLLPHRLCRGHIVSEGARLQARPDREHLRLAVLNQAQCVWCMLCHACWTRCAKPSRAVFVACFAAGLLKCQAIKLSMLHVSCQAIKPSTLHVSCQAMLENLLPGCAVSVILCVLLCFVTYKRCASYAHRSTKITHTRHAL